MKKVLLAHARAALLILALLIPIASGAENEPMRVAVLSGNVGLSMVKLIDRPEAVKYPVRFEVYNNPNPVLAKLVSGDLDLAGLPANMAAILYNKGVPVQLASIIGWGVMYVISSDATIKTWPDLRNREVYVASKGAISDILFRYLVNKNGLDPEKDMKIQYIASAAELAQLAASGKATIAAVPEPWVTEALEKDPRLKIVLDYQQEWRRMEKQGLNYPQTCIVVRKGFAREHPQALREFLKDLESAISWANTHPEAAGVLAEKYVQIPAAVAQKGMARSNLRYADAYKVRREVDLFLHRLAEYAPDSVGGKVPDEAFYYQP